MLVRPFLSWSVASVLAASCAAVALLQSPAQAEVVTFDDLMPGTGSALSGADPDGRYYDGLAAPGTIEQGPFGDVNVSTFTSGGVAFTNRTDLTFGLWSGFAYSNVNDTTTQGFMNPYAAVTGTGLGPGRDNYGVAFGYDDVVPNLSDPDPFDPTSVADLMALPSFTLPTGASIVGMHVTNTTYAALSMMNGDSVAKAFGGPTGDDPDWFKVTAYGIDALGNPLAAAVEFYLADFRFEDNTLDYIVTDWSFMDLSALADARSLHFNLSSSDAGPFGLNTPTYFAVDNIQIQPAAVPEPSSLVLLALVGGSAVAVRRFRGRSKRETERR